MKQIVVIDGHVQVIECDELKLAQGRSNRVLVKVHYSAVSPGTELALLQNKNRPNGLTLGYSAAGEVIGVGEQVTGISIGDFVACYGGPYVHHSEMLSVPERLCVKLASSQHLRRAAFAGLGAIAIHSVRRLTLQFGENVWVMGLGVLGQMIAQISTLANYRVLATDMYAARCELVQRFGIRHAYAADEAGLHSIMNKLTEGYGFDAIAVCAHSNRANIIDIALERLALRGKIAIVGNVPMSFSRELFFQKEADLVIASAAGPGRYDEQYEDFGIDYPRSYVRWTEGRNLTEFIRQLEAGLLDVESLITHEIPFADAPEGYRMLQNEQSATLGVLLRYV